MVKKVILASNNAGKARELGSMLLPTGWEVIPQIEFSLSSAEETGLTFVENAIIKARHACSQTGLPAIADDSGLEIDALNGQPGIYSSRFSIYPDNKGIPSDEKNNLKVLELLAGLSTRDRSARFQCILVFMRHAEDPTPRIFSGTWEGYILEEPRGKNGFGYDPIFFCNGQGCSSAELDTDVKNSISHRGQAMQKLLKHFG